MSEPFAAKHDDDPTGLDPGIPSTGQEYREKDRIAAKEDEMKKDPLHDALVAIFEAIAERENKSIEEVVAEFVEGYERG